MSVSSDLLILQRAITALLQRLNNQQKPVKKITESVQFSTGFSVFEWLEAQSIYPKCYWCDRNQQEVIALGELKGFSDVESAQQYLYSAKLHNKQRIWGGQAFPSSLPSSSSLPNSTYFFLPHIELIRINSSWELCVNIDTSMSWSSAVAQVRKKLQKLCFYQALWPEWNNIISTITHQPNYAQWSNIVNQALHHIKEKIIQKVVLARESSIHFVEPTLATQLLKASCQRNFYSFHFLFTRSKERAFLGSTPERLYLHSHQHLKTEALAGTIKRGDSAEEDENLASFLLKDDKNQRENQLVVDDIVERLQDHTNMITVKDSTTILKLRQIQHLKRDIKAQLKPNITSAQLLSVLHPTAAVAGFPRQPSIDFILKNESFSRGWYSGAIGYISYEKSEFCVAIRSALFENSVAKFYAGAGIVAGSTVNQEWQELDRKLATLLH